MKYQRKLSTVRRISEWCLLFSLFPTTFQGQEHLSVQELLALIHGRYSSLVGGQVVLSRDVDFREDVENTMGEPQPAFLVRTCLFFQGTGFCDLRNLFLSIVKGLPLKSLVLTLWQSKCMSMYPGFKS